MSTAKEDPESNGTRHIFDRLVNKLGDPVEFELPDRFNKWKRKPYKFLRRNIYLTKKVKRRHEDDGIFCSCSPSPGSNSVCGRDCHCGSKEENILICCEKLLLAGALAGYDTESVIAEGTISKLDFPKWMLLSSCSSGCKCDCSCLNKPFHLRPTKKMKLVQTEKCGAGIVAEEDIKRGEFVIEYVGEVIDDKTCEERLWKMKHHGETNFYLCEINRDMVIDATYKGNKSRYINHSCSPNTEMQKWSIDGETRIGIFATRDIKRGEYLTYDYQFVQFGADQDCHCGAAGCRRKLGVKTNKPKTPSSDDTLKLVASQVYQNGSIYGDHRATAPNCIGELVMINRRVNKEVHDTRSFGIIRQFDCITKKHLIMFENGAIESLDMSKEEWEFVTC